MEPGLIDVLYFSTLIVSFDWWVTAAWKRQTDTKQKDFTINSLPYQPGGLVPMEFLQVPPYQDNFFQGLDQRLK